MIDSDNPRLHAITFRGEVRQIEAIHHHGDDWWWWFVGEPASPEPTKAECADVVAQLNPKRDAKLRRLHAEGRSIRDLAELYGLSRRRLSKIVAAA